MKYLQMIAAGICSLLCTVCSCATGAETAALILGGSSEAPVFLSCKAVSQTEINFEFSLPVKVTSLRFSPEISLETVEEGSTVKVHFSGGPGPGEKITADLLAEDSNGNTISVLVPLRTRNDRIPKFRINELRTEYSKPKCEFIELKTLTTGNPGGLRLFIAGNGKASPVYEFPPFEAAAGEYITLHLRTLEDGCQNELGGNLDESGGADSSAAARDLWVPGSTKLLRKTDAVYFLDQDDRIAASVLIAETADPWWNKDYLAAAAEFLYENGTWKTAGDTACGPADAVQSAGTTVTRTICLDEATEAAAGTSAGWYITANSCATPGRPNNPKRYN